MADFLLSVGVDVGLSYDQMQKDISNLVTQLNQNPQRVRVGLEIDHSAIERFRTEVANIHNSMGGLGRVTVSPVDTGGLNNAIDGIARLAQSTQGAISTVQTMRAELNSVNAERIQQAIASINGISAEGASALAHSLGEANVRATEVRARLLEAADAEQQLVALQVRGTNEAGHMVNYLMTYNTETGEISRRMVDITARLEDATAAESHRATTVREITDLYRQMHALMRTNTNATNIASYAELANQAQLLQDALALARTESISIDEALTRLGTSGATAIGGARDAMSAFRLEMEQTGSSGSVSLTTMYNTVAQMQTLLNNNAGYANLGTYTNLQTQVNLLAQAIELASNGGMTLEAALNAVGLNGSTAIHNAREAMSAFKAEMSGATAEEERLTIGTANYRTALERINTLLRQVRANTEKWTAAKTGKSSADYQVYADQARELENLAQRLSTGTMTTREFNAEYSRIRSTASGAETSIKAAGEATQTWTQRVGKLTEKFGTWFSITRVIMAAYRAVREMVSAVIDLDTAMTELKKVTNETDATYEKFLVNATKRAKTLGAELADTVSATADFARLGFGIADAEKLADAAIVYKNVGEGIDDIGTASESIIATMQAFSIPAEEVMKIVDKFNEVGNNYAISSKGVGDALLRSAAAMHSANNTLDETIALATASNTIVQDPEKVGTTLKTVSMYLRAAKTEADEAGESTEGMANSVSELRNEILALTGNKVDIQIDDDTFKSTYQILQELSKVWHELSDVSQANILEMVGGKRNSNVVAAILENFSVAEKALQTSAESAGSALVENEKYLKSIEGRLSIFKAVFQELSNTLIQGDFVKGVVDFGTNLLNVLNVVAKIIDVVGGLNTILMVTVGIIATINADTIIKFLSGVLKGIGKIVPALETFITKIAELPLAMRIARSEGQGLSSAFDLVGISASTAQIAVASFAIAITLIASIIRAYNRAQQEARDAAIEHANAVSQNNEKIEEYKNEIIELRKALDVGNLSESEAYDTRRKLVEIEESLINLFGKEAEGIDVVTGSINDQIAAINTLSELEWDKYVKNNTGAINKVVDVFTDFSPQDLNFWSAPAKDGYINIEALSSRVLWDAIDDLSLDIVPKDFHDKLQQELEDADIGIEIPITGIIGDFASDVNADSVYDYLEVYQKLYDITENLSKEYFGESYMDYAGEALSAYSARINELSTYIRDSEEMFNTYVEGLLLYEDEYAGVYSKALAAKKEYDDAVLSGDDTAVAAALQKMQGVQNEFLNAGWDNEAVNLYMNEFFDAFNVASQQRKGLIEIETVLKNPEDVATKAAVEAAQTFADESGKISMEAILNAGIDYEKTGDATSEQAKAYIKLKTLADEYGLSVESVIGVMTGLGLITVEVLEAPVDDFDRAKTAATSFLTSLQGVQEILSSQMAGRSISVEDFNAEGMEDYRSALEYTNGAMQLNAEKVREITEAKAAEEKQTIATNKALAQDQYLKNAQQIEEYRNKLNSVNFENGETAESIQASIDALLSENSALADTCKQYDLLSASITEATSAYSHWLNSQNASDYGDMANDAVNAIKKIRNTYDSDSEDYGNFGSKKFDAAVDFIVPDTVDQDDLAAVEAYMNSFQQYLVFDENGGATGLNIDQFLSNAVEAGLMSYSEDDGFQVLGGKKMEDFAKGLNMSSGMVTAFFDELQLKGAEFDWGDEGIKTFGDLAVEANEAAEALRLVEANKDLKIKIDVSDLSTTEEQVGALDDTIASMNTIKGRVNVSAEEVEYANSVIQYCITQKQLLTQPDVMRVDTSQCEGDVANVIKLLQDFQTAQNNLEIQQSLGMDTTEAQSSVDSLYADIQALTPEVKTTLGLDTTSLEALQTSLLGVTAEVLVTYGVNAEAVNGYNPESKTCDVIYNPKTDLLPQSFDDISVSVYYDPDTDDLPTYFKTITRYVNYVATGDSKVQGTAHAGGTAAAGGDWGTASGGNTLVGELGREIVVDPHTGRWYTVGDNGAEFVNIPAGAIVFNHIQTESLLNNGYVSGRASALVSGTAMVTGGYKPYKPTGGYSGGGSSSNYSSSGSNSGNYSSSNSSTNNSSSDEESWFEKQYKLHNHLVNMNQETDEEYLTWLADAYKQAYNEGIIELDEYRNYAEEVYTGLQELFKDYLDDIEHEISMRENFDSETTTIIAMYQGLMKDIETEIAAARAAGLDDSDEYIQNLQDRWWEYSDAIMEIREDAAEAAKDVVDELVEYRIDMIKQELEDEKDALDKKLDYLKEFYDKQKELLQDQYDEKKYLEEQSEKRKTVTDLKYELAMLANDDSAWAQKRKLELQAELSEAEDDLGNFEDEHALDLVLDNLDSVYEAKEKEIQAQKDVLDEVLNDPETLYNKALTDIQKTAKDQLYYQMLEYNARHGDGNPETVNEIWENAYGALTEYQKLFGELYKNIEISNSTGVDNKSDGWNDSTISGTNSDDGGSLEAGDDTQELYPYGKVSDVSKTLKYGSRGNEVKALQYALNLLGFGNSGTESLDGDFGNGTKKAVKAFQKSMGITQDGIVGKNTKAKFKTQGYASGTKHATAGLHELYERGAETLFVSGDGSKYRILNYDDKVLNAKATNFLYDFANSGGGVLEKMLKNVFGGAAGLDGIVPTVISNEINMGDIIVQGSTNERTVSEIRRAQRESVDFMLREFTKLNK